MPRPALFGLLPLLLFQVGGTVGASHNQPGHRGLDVLAIAIAVLGPISLLFLLRWPRQVRVCLAVALWTYRRRDVA